MAIFGPAPDEPSVPLTPLAATAAQVRFVPIDGGAHDLAAEPLSAWMDSHILLGAWMEQPSLSPMCAEMLQWATTSTGTWAARSGGISSTDGVIRQGGMHVAASSEDANTGPETVSWNGDDEADMRFGPGSDEWENGRSRQECVPSGAARGYTDADFYYADDTKRVTGEVSLPYRIDGARSTRDSAKACSSGSPPYRLSTSWITRTSSRPTAIG